MTDSDESKSNSDAPNAPEFNNTSAPGADLAAAPGAGNTTASASNSEPEPGVDATSASASNNVPAILGLCMIAMSSVLVEIALTKFISYKVFHHYVYAVISVVILSLGLAGTFVYLFPRLFGQDNQKSWARTAYCAAGYAITLPLAIVFFAWLPLDPYEPQVIAFAPHMIPLFQAFVLAIYLSIFAVPFLFAGLCISHVLAASRLPVRTIFFWDLVAAAIGAGVCPFIIETFGGYGTIAIASILGIIASFALARVGKASQPMVVLVNIIAAGAIGLNLVYPSVATALFNIDIQSHKDERFKWLAIKDFGGIDKTYWNAIARIDVSKTGTSDTGEFNAGLTHHMKTMMKTGRFILVDGGAPTRQFKLDKHPSEDEYIKTSLWANPYIVQENKDGTTKVKRSLVIGGGGGIDILVAKSRRIPEVDVLEINPATAKYVLQGGSPEEAKGYQDWLASDEKTKVRIHNTEARHYCSTQKDATYDVIQASAVDTLTAITSGALSMTDNHLYTIDAVREYMRILKPTGVLSLTHWRLDPPTTAARMLNTYIEYLESIDVKNPSDHVIVTCDEGWCDLMLKKEPFTADEIARIKSWATSTGRLVLVDPTRTEDAPPRDSEKIFAQIAHLSKEERLRVLSEYKYGGPLGTVINVTAVTDDKPYFYSTNEFYAISAIFSSTPVALLFCAIFAASTLVILPLFKLGARAITGSLLLNGIYFGICGFAFLLFELTMLQQFTIFVGGPLYSLSVVLVSVLAGYGIGSLLAEKLGLNTKTFIGFAIALPVFLVALYFIVPAVVVACMPLPMPVRILISAAITLLSSMLVGMPVPTAMAAIRARHASAVAWMWGISSGFNAIGAMAFVLITQVTGIKASFIIIAVLYFLANLLFAATGPLARAKQPKAVKEPEEAGNEKAPEEEAD